MRHLHTFLFLVTISLFLTHLNSCGSKRKGQSGGGSNTGDTVNTTGNEAGVPKDGNQGSFDPHPTACTTCATNGLNPVLPNDPNNDNPRNLVCDPAKTAGTVVACEGMCFVDDSVTPRWNNEPPSSGPTYPDPSYGYGVQAEVVERGYWVHSLAHGYVVITYNCPTGCDSDVAKFAEIYNDLAGSPILITADPHLVGSKFAAVGWGYQMLFDTVDSDALECFVMQHLHHGYPHGDYVPRRQ